MTLKRASVDNIALIRASVYSNGTVITLTTFSLVAARKVILLDNSLFHSNHSYKKLVCWLTNHLDLIYHGQFRLQFLLVVTSKLYMMLSPKGKIFRVAGLWRGQSTGQRWIPLTRASDASFDAVFNVRLNKRWFEAQWRSLWRHWNEEIVCILVFRQIGHCWRAQKFSMGARHGLQLFIPVHWQPRSNYHDAEFVAIGACGRHGKLWCHQGCPNWHYDNSVAILHTQYSHVAWT